MSTSRDARQQGAVPAHARSVFSAALDLVEDFELPERPATTAGQPFGEARLLVRVEGEPVGFVSLALETGPLSMNRILHAVAEQLPGALKLARERRSSPDWLALLAGGAQESSRAKLQGEQRVAIIVCTRNRAAQLEPCLRSLQAVTHEQLELLVVDNAPRDSATRELVRGLAEGDRRLRYVCEDLPGLSCARNRGLHESKATILAYTDDDVRVDPLWVAALLRGFERSGNVGCVTGLVASASLELAAERYFDGRVWWSSSCQPRIYDSHHGPNGSALHPYAAGGFGTGANFAVRAEMLRQLGGFDECLGAGSSCEGGEDLDIFVRFILAGHAIAYEPAALVWHEHRAGSGELAQQMYSYGKALSAFLSKYTLCTATRFDVLRRLPHGLAHLALLGARSQRVGARTGLDYGPALAEARGLFAGPLAYAKARRSQDPERRRAVAP